MKKTDSKFNVLYEDTLYRFQQGGLLTGDVVKIRTDALNNDKIKPMAEQVKEQIKNAIDTDLNLRVASIKSIRPNTTQNYNGYGTDAPTDFYVDIVVEYAPGLWREPMTLPMEILERVDTGINMAPVPDSLKRPNEITKPAEVTVNDNDRATPKSNTVLSNTPDAQDGRSQAQKPEERKGPGDGSPQKLTEKLEDVYDNMLLLELHGEGLPEYKEFTIDFKNAYDEDQKAKIINALKGLLGQESSFEWIGGNDLVATTKWTGIRDEEVKAVLNTDEANIANVSSQLLDAFDQQVSEPGDYPDQDELDMDEPMYDPAGDPDEGMFHQ